jgi:hypothetical protein
MAQVFSQNAVGYYNVALGGGFTMIANQLNNGDNNLNTILPDGLPDGSTFLTWTSGQMFSDADTFFAGFGWVNAALELTTTAIGPGGGGFINLPPATSATVTMVGEVPQGDLDLDLVANFQIVSQLTPQELGIDATGFPAGDGDTALFWDTTLQTYTEAVTYFAGFGWVNAALELDDPTPAIGESFFYNRAPANGLDTWTRAFSVNP